MKSTKDHIITTLLQNPGITAKYLHTLLSRQNTNKTLQTIHHVLKQLITEETVVKHKQQLFINQSWIYTMQKLFATNNALTLQPGESSTFIYKSLTEHDIHYRHIIHYLRQNIEDHFYASAPHNIWIHLPEREVLEQENLKDLAQQNNNTYIITNLQTQNDKEDKKQITASKNYCAFEKANEHMRRRHIVVLGEYVTETLLKDYDEKNIHKIYTQHTDRKAFLKHLKKYLSEISWCKTTIYRDKEKAEKIKKVILKPFI